MPTTRSPARLLLPLTALLLLLPVALDAAPATPKATSWVVGAPMEWLHRIAAHFIGDSTDDANGCTEEPCEDETISRDAVVTGADEPSSQSEITSSIDPNG